MKLGLLTIVFLKYNINALDSNQFKYILQNRKIFENSKESACSLLNPQKQKSISSGKYYGATFDESFQGPSFERECLQDTCTPEEFFEATTWETLESQKDKLTKLCLKCEDNLCHAEGTEKCENLYNKFKCHCNLGYFGTHCDKKLVPSKKPVAAAKDHCKNPRCIKYGTDSCQSLSRGYKCNCKSGYKGKYCGRMTTPKKLKVNKCEYSLNKCSKFGTKSCELTSNWYKCTCKEDYDGKYCLKRKVQEPKKDVIMIDSNNKSPKVVPSHKEEIKEPIKQIKKVVVKPKSTRSRKHRNHLRVLDTKGLCKYCPNKHWYTPNYRTDYFIKQNCYFGYESDSRKYIQCINVEPYALHYEVIDCWYGYEYNKDAMSESEICKRM